MPQTWNELEIIMSSHVEIVLFMSLVIRKPTYKMQGPSQEGTFIGPLPDFLPYANTNKKAILNLIRRILTHRFFMALEI